MAGFDGLRLFPYYLNSRRLGLLADVNFAIEAQNPLVENSGERDGSPRRLKKSQALHSARDPYTRIGGACRYENHA
jgi:hypothetical protein